MTDPIKRMNFFDGQFLRAPEFQLVQDYHLDQLRDHMRSLHTPGIAPGTLDVVTQAAGSTAVNVNPGIAFDSAGRRIALTEPRLIELVGVLPVDKPVFITIAYHEVPSDQTDETGIQGFTRVNEDPLIAASIAPPDHPEDQLVLAVAKRDATGKVTAIDGSARRTAGLKAGDLGVTSVKFQSASVDPAGWVATDLGASGRLDVHGNLRVTGNLILGGGIQPDTIAAPQRSQPHAALSSIPTPGDFARVKLVDENVAPEGWVNLTLGGPGQANVDGSLQITRDLVVGGTIIGNVVPPAAVFSGTLTQLDFARVGLADDNVPRDGWVNLTLGAPGQASVGGSLQIARDLVVGGTIRGDIAVGTVQVGDLANAAVVTSAIADGAVTGPKLAANSIDGTKIIDGSVGSNELADSAVTGAKLAPNSIDGTKIVDGSIGTNELAVAAVSTLKLADAAVTGAKLSPNSVDGTKVIDGSIGSSELADAAVTAAKLAGNSVDGTKIVDGSIGSNELADAAVTAAKLAANSVDGTKIIDGSVGSAELADAAVTTAKLANNSVTAIKIPDGSIGSTKLVDNSVSGAKIAAGSVGTAKLGADVQQTLNAASAHIVNGANPHSTTAEQVGALPSSGGMLLGVIDDTADRLRVDLATDLIGLYLEAQARPNIEGIRLVGGTAQFRANYFSGLTAFAHKVSFWAGKDGYVVDRCINGGSSTLCTGDVVKLRGTTVVRFRGDLNRLPVPEVVPADKESDTMVIGIVHLGVTPAPEERDLRANPEDPTSIPAGEELDIVTLGVFAHCKVDASEAAIDVGDLLTTSSNPGFAKKATNPKLGTIIGKALEPLHEGTGYISVFVNIQ
jgi:hypothetical protein